MRNEIEGRARHSAESFGDARDHWWNRDFFRADREAVELRYGARCARRRLRLSVTGACCSVPCGSRTSASPASIANSARSRRPRRVRGRAVSKLVCRTGRDTRSASRSPTTRSTSRRASRCSSTCPMLRRRRVLHRGGSQAHGGDEGDGGGSLIEGRRAKTSTIERTVARCNADRRQRATRRMRSAVSSACSRGAVLADERAA